MDAGFKMKEATGGTFLRLRFCGLPCGGQGCRWLLNYEGDLLSSLVWDVHIWANGKARVNDGAAIELRSVENRRMELTISGQGKDGRCRWCRTFRSGLKTAVRREYGRQAFVLDGACIFDREAKKAA